MRAVSASAALVVYDHFNYLIGTVIADGGILGTAENGFGGGWAFSGLTGEIVDNLGCGGLKTAGNALEVRLAGSEPGYLFRGMDTALTNGTYYLGILFHRSDYNNGGSENWHWDLRESASYPDGLSSSLQISAGSTSSELPSLTVSGDSSRTGSVPYEIGSVYFMLVRFTINPAGSDTADIKFYKSGDVLPVEAADIAWDASSTGSFVSAAGWRFTLPPYIPSMVLDEFRLGTELSDVIVSTRNSPAGSGVEDFQESLLHSFQSVSLFKISDGSDSNKYIAVDTGTGYTENSSVELQDASTQKWFLDEIDSDRFIYRLRCSDAPSYCLSAAGASTGTAVQIKSWQDLDSQKWIVDPGTNGLIRFLAYSESNLCLHAASLTNDAPLDLAARQANDNGQQWQMTIQGNIQEPDITVGTDGSLLASYKYLYGGDNNGMLYASQDGGQTWVLRKKFDVGIYGQILFPMDNVLYMFYRSSESALQLRISKSTDHGYNWTDFVVGTFSDAVIPGGGVPVISDGIVYFAFTDDGGPASSWPGYFRLHVASCPTNVDLTVASNWTFTDAKAFPTSAQTGGRTANGWIEPQCALGPDGRVWVIARVDNPDDGDLSAMLKVSLDRKTLEFINQYPATGTATGFFEAPWAGNSRFDVRYDSVSGKYLMLSSPYMGARSENPRHPNARNILALYESTDLKSFSLVKTLINDDAFEDWRLSSWFSGFQYPSFVINGDDFYYISRTSYKSFDNQHDANHATAHVLENFRNYLSPDGEIAAYRFNTGTDAGYNAAKMRGSNADVHGAAYIASGKNGGCLSFNGADSWIGLMRRVSPKFYGAKQISISVWLRPAAVSSPGAVFTSPIDGLASGISLQLLYDKIVLAARSCTDDALQARRFVFDSDGKWHHIVALWDFENDTMRVWLDKAEQTGAETVSFSRSKYTRGAPAVQDTIGCHYNKLNFFKGEIDEFHIYGRALSQDEIDKLFSESAVQQGLLFQLVGTTL